MGILNENVEAIEEDEYLQLLNGINKQSQINIPNTLKRKLDSVPPVSRDVKCKFDLVPQGLYEEFKDANNVDCDIHPEIILTSELNGNTQYDISGIEPYQEIIMDSNDTCQVADLQQEMTPIPNFMLLTSDEHQWQSSPFNFF